jgi:hypothetical protein
MWSRVSGEMRAAHTHRATAEMDGAATHTHTAAAAAEMGATATAEVSATAAATKVTAPTAAAAETTAASGISDSRQTKGKAYCGRACCYFPHDTTSSSGPNAQTNPQIDRAVPADPKMAMLQCTRHRSAPHASFEMWIS